MTANRVDYLGVCFTPVDMGAALARLEAVGATDGAITVVTPNVDHLVRLHDARIPAEERAALARAYRGAALCLCDSRILARLAAADGVRLPVVPGSDLTAALLQKLVRPGDPVAIVGGDAVTLDALRLLAPADYRQTIPPMGLRRDVAARDAVAAWIEETGARFTLLAVGSPQQELIAERVRERGKAGGALLCIGASVDFLTGHARRAPRWMQHAHLEWLHRLASEPRRMWRRYLVDGPRILKIRAQWRRERA